MSTRTLASLALSFLAAGCTDAGVNQPTGAGGKGDQIGQDDPWWLIEYPERTLAKLVSEVDIGKSFGVEDAAVPYPDTNWPMVDNGVAVQWLEKSGARCSVANACVDPQPSPLAKLVALTAPDDVAAAIDWEVKHHGKEVPGVASWWGHCPGWTASALLNPPVERALSVRMEGGKLETCESGEGCTRFEIGDINAVSAEAHEGAESRFVGARCDTKPSEIERDQYGRIVRSGAGCQGLNAGAMLMVVGNRLKRDHLPFAMDAQNEARTDEIWNQPAYRYTVNRFEHLTESEAANLVASGGASRTGDETTYLWNDAANGFAFVDLTLKWVDLHGPNLDPVSGLDVTGQTRMVAVIELDGDPDASTSAVIGGEYLDDASVGANRLTNAPFVWVADDMPFYDSAHNPFVSGELVKQLLALTQE